MANLFNRTWTRSELLNYVGDLSQIAGIRLGEWADGTERGLRVADVRTGSGLAFSVLLDRGMDIGPASYKGMPLAWVSPTGWAHPMYFDPQGTGWLRTFGGGLLTGCGLTYLSAQPAKMKASRSGCMDACRTCLPSMCVWMKPGRATNAPFGSKGEMRQARVFGENLRLKRRITVALGGNRICPPRPGRKPGCDRKSADGPVPYQPGLPVPG